MHPNTPNHSTSYRFIAGRAWPIILANSATPLLGLTDTAVIGRTGSIASLGAVAIGSLIFSFVYWTFGFLRMGTTGFVAQAHGAENELEVRTAIGRAVLMGVVIGLSLIVLQIPIFKLALYLLEGSEEVKAITSSYLKLRIWGAPAALASYAIMGALIGLGRSKALLGVQVAMNTVNIGLDVLLAGYFGMGVKGIALGTMIAEWTAALLALFLIIRILKERNLGDRNFWDWRRITDSTLLLKVFGVHFNIMIRTLCLLFGFGWFTQQGARLGDVQLAANHILLQFISFSAFFLDGIAYATEALVGAAAGARKIDVFDTLVRRTTLLAGILALTLSSGFLIFGNLAISALTDLALIREAAATGLPFAALYILLSFPTFQLDGIYIGTTRTSEMRNAGLIGLIAFLAIGWPLTHIYGNTGLWLAFIGFIILRAASLMVFYPNLRKSIRKIDHEI